MGKLYTKDSIESLSPLEFTRKKPGVYCGDTTYSTQLLVEILSNAIDEFRAGHGNKIEIKIDGDVCSVYDYGQGFLVNELREDGKTVLEAAFSVINTSGKYNEDGTYEGTSLGSFGIGSKITNYLSHYLIVETIRDGKFEKIEFTEGEFSKRNLGTTQEPSGTKVKWKPSEEFFTHTEVELDKIKELIITTCSLCQGLTIILTVDGKSKTYFSKNGLDDLVDLAVKDHELIKNRYKVNYKEDKYMLDMVMTYTDKYSSTIVPYVNTGLTESGPHISNVKSVITRELNKFFRDKGWLKDKDANFSGDDVQEGLYTVFNITCPNVAYNAQVKTTITKIDMTPFTSVIASTLRTWMESNEKDIQSMFEKANSARKTREAVKKARDKAREQNKKKEKALKFDSKLADCWSKDRKKCELIVVEGDSAAGNLKTARDNEFQAVLPVRGKILNVRKAKTAKIQKNAEIMSLIEAIGLTVDPKTMELSYDKSDLRYGKIVIMSDADVK